MIMYFNRVIDIGLEMQLCTPGFKFAEKDEVC